MKKIITLALLAGATLYGNPVLWQVSILYPEPNARLDKLAPNPDHYFFFQALPTLADWLQKGYITAFGENACSEPCFASSTPLHPVVPTPTPTVPEPGTFAVTAAMAAVWIWRKKGQR